MAAIWQNVARLKICESTACTIRVAQNVQKLFADTHPRNPGTLGTEVSKNTFFVNFEACPDMPVEL